MENLNLSKVRVRIAPSPTGYIHIGTLRTVLYNYLFAKRNNGNFIVRVEDTDRTRMVKGAIEDLLQTLEWAEIEPQEGPYLDGKKIKQKGEYGPYIQSERLDLYQKHINDLIDKNKAYYCFCTKERLEDLRENQKQNKLPPKYDQLCRNLDKKDIQRRIAKGDLYVIRFKMPEDKEVVFEDEIRGVIKVNTKDLDDFVLIKADGYPTYHFANVVDDHLMKITHVLRGDEWIASTPKHILLYEALGWHAPLFAHLPPLLNKDKKKLSKRQGDVSVKDFIDKGYLKEALINFIALLGWNAGTDQEIYTRDELAKQFSLENVHKAGAFFDLEKLDWINGIYLRELSVDKFVEQALPFLISAGLIKELNKKIVHSKTREVISQHWLKQVCALEQPRVKKLSDLPEAIKFFFEDQPRYAKAVLIWKKGTLKSTKQALEGLIEVIEQINDKKFNLETIEKQVRNYIDQNNYNNGEVLWPMRVALSGRDKSPGPFEIATVLGKGKTIKRLIKAIKKL